MKQINKTKYFLTIVWRPRMTHFRVNSLTTRFRANHVAGVSWWDTLYLTRAGTTKQWHGFLIFTQWSRLNNVWLFFKMDSLINEWKWGNEPVRFPFWKFDSGVHFLTNAYEVFHIVWAEVDISDWLQASRYNKA